MASRPSRSYPVSVGAAVPTVLDIHPAWRSYEYFVYNEQVIIVDPHDWHIVEVIVLS